MHSGLGFPKPVFVFYSKGRFGLNWAWQTGKIRPKFRAGLGKVGGNTFIAFQTQRHGFIFAGFGKMTRDDWVSSGEYL